MKALLTILVTLFVISVAPAQERHSGQKEVLFGFGGFSELNISNINKGTGFRYWFAPELSGRGTVGFTLSNGTDEGKEVSVSSAVLVELGHTNNTAVYFGPTLAYYHDAGQTNTYAFGGVLGGEFSPWDHVTFGAEYGLSIFTQAGLTRVQFGETTGTVSIGLEF